jgi:hypothetical protein
MDYANIKTKFECHKYLHKEMVSKRHKLNKLNLLHAHESVENRKCIELDSQHAHMHQYPSIIAI